jgi:hypothetical protein
MGSTRSGTAGAWAGANYLSATGATSVVGTNGATFYITGVQLEKGSTATSFDYRPYGTELALCQRYFYLHANGADADKTISLGVMYNSGLLVGVVQFPVTMRAAPTLVSSSNTDDFYFYRDNNSDPFNSFTGINEPSTTCANIRNGTQVSGTAGQAGFIIADKTTSNLAFNSEL